MPRLLSCAPLRSIQPLIPILLIAWAAPAHATSTFSAGVEVTVTLIAVGGETRLIGITDVEELNTSAVGSLGTFASSSTDGEPDDATVLGVGDGITFDSNVNGAAIHDPLVASEATAVGLLSGMLELDSFFAGERIVTIEVAYSLSAIAAAELLTLEEAFARAHFAITTESGQYSFSDERIADTATNEPGGEASTSFQFDIVLGPNGSDVVFFSAGSEGFARSAVPEPGTLALLALGLAALARPRGRA